MKIIKKMTVSALIALAIMVPISAHAAEGGSGHYTPGAPGADKVPPVKKVQ